MTTNEQEAWLRRNTFECRRLRARVTPAQCQAMRGAGGKDFGHGGGVSNPPQCATCSHWEEGRKAVENRIAQDPFGGLIFTEYKGIIKSAVPCVSVHANGSLAINKAALEALGHPPRVRLSYCRTGAQIVLRIVPASDEDRAAFSLNIGGKGKGVGKLSTEAFSRAAGIAPSQMSVDLVYSESAVGWCASLKATPVGAPKGGAK